jgi:hypothetical protein
MKKYYIMYNVGKAKYLLNVHNGIVRHSDGSEFFGCEIFKNKKKLQTRISELVNDGYVECRS